MDLDYSPTSVDAETSSKSLERLRALGRRPSRFLREMYARGGRVEVEHIEQPEVGPIADRARDAGFVPLVRVREWVGGFLPLSPTVEIWVDSTATTKLERVVRGGSGSQYTLQAYFDDGYGIILWDEQGDQKDLQSRHRKSLGGTGSFARDLQVFREAVEEASDDGPRQLIAIPTPRHYLHLEELSARYLRPGAVIATLVSVDYVVVFFALTGGSWVARQAGWWTEAEPSWLLPAVAVLVLAIRSAWYWTRDRHRRVPGFR